MWERLSDRKHRKKQRAGNVFLSFLWVFFGVKSERDFFGYQTRTGSGKSPQKVVRVTTVLLNGSFSFFVIFDKRKKSPVVHKKLLFLTALFANHRLFIISTSYMTYMDKLRF